MAGAGQGNASELVTCHMKSRADTSWGAVTKAEGHLQFSVLHLGKLVPQLPALQSGTHQPDPTNPSRITSSKASAPVLPHPPD